MIFLGFWGFSKSKIFCTLKRTIVCSVFNFWGILFDVIGSGCSRLGDCVRYDFTEPPAVDEFAPTSYLIENPYYNETTFKRSCYIDFHEDVILTIGSIFQLSPHLFQFEYESDRSTSIYEIKDVPERIMRGDMLYWETHPLAQNQWQICFSQGNSH